MSNDEQYFMPPTLMGTVYWKDHVVAVVDDHGQAEQAVADLRAAGLAGDDAKAWSAEFVMKNHAYYLENRTALQRLGSVISSHEDEIMQGHVDKVKQGHSIVTVRVPDLDRAREVSQVLAKRGVRLAKYFRAGTIVDL